MKNNPRTTKLRRTLKEEEKQLLGRMDQEAKDLEKQLEKNLKIIGGIGAGLLGGLTLYKSLTTKKEKAKAFKNTRPNNSSLVGSTIVLAAVKMLLPAIVKKIQQSLDVRKDVDTQSPRK